MNLDLGSIAKTLLGGDALSGIASQTGASTKDITSVLTNALPLLIQGAGKQSSNKDTASSFLSALEQHSAKETSSLSSFFKNVDINDGAKIVSHLLGNDNKSTAEKLSKELNIDAATITKILAAAAPLLMSLLGKKTASAKTESKESVASSIAQSLLENVDVGGLLKGFLK